MANALGSLRMQLQTSGLQVVDKQLFEQVSARLNATAPRGRNTVQNLLRYSLVS